MDHFNRNDVLNLSQGGEDGVLSKDGVQDHNLEAYTVVLSTAAHILSMFFGGGSSMAVIIAITTRRNINKYSYMLVLMLFLACCCLNFIWSPLEIANLIMYHYVHKHPCDSYVAIKTAVYLFLILLISFLVVFLSAEGIVRMKNCSARLFRKTWPLLSSVSAVVASALLTAIFIAKCIQSGNYVYLSYIITDSKTRFLVLVLVTLAFCLTAIALIIVALLMLVDSVYWEDGRPHLRQKKMKLTIPEFLISQSNACADNDGGFEPSQSGTPSPSTPKLLMVGDPDTTSIKGEDANAISDLPSPLAKPMGNRLGINMAQVLGRRRHTICQISDSSSTTSTPADPISRAKQYNYVRKFSVDISALQAQLQNPKVFKEAPFQSDIDLSKKQASDTSQSPNPKPLLPLKPLPLKFDEKDEKSAEHDKKESESESGGFNVPPPPVIMVSNDDAPPACGETEKVNDAQSSKETFQEETPPSAIATAQKPTSLTFKDSAPEDHISAPTFDSAITDPSDDESEGQKMARLTVLLCLTFVLNMLPVFVTELLEDTLSSHAFINISTCTWAVSAIQTIVYPHLIACSDDVVHRAVQKLKKRVKNVCPCRAEAEAHSHVEDSSSTSQV